MAKEPGEVTLSCCLEIARRLIFETAAMSLLGECTINEDVEAAEFLQHLIVEGIDRSRIEKIKRQTVYIVTATLHFIRELLIAFAGA